MITLQHGLMPGIVSFRKQSEYPLMGRLTAYWPASELLAFCFWLRFIGRGLWSCFKRLFGLSHFAGLSCLVWVLIGCDSSGESGAATDPRLGINAQHKSAGAHASIDQKQGSSKNLSPWTFSGPTMGTHYSVKVYPPTALHASESRAQMKKDIDGLLTRVNTLMSTYHADSELSRFNASAPNQRFEISLETHEVLALANQVHALSEGFFDVTVGPLVDLWGFGAQGRRLEPPSDQVIEQRLSSVGQLSLKLTKTKIVDDQEVPIAQLIAPLNGQAAQVREVSRGDGPVIMPRKYFVQKNKAVRVDLSAIAKGYAVDLIAQYLWSSGAEHFLVEVGGEVSTAGYKHDGSPWRIAIEVPQPGRRAVQRVLNLVDVAVATSGNYRNFFEYKGKRYAHSIDPRSGWPVAHGLASVTVLVPVGISAKETDDLLSQAADNERVVWRSGTAKADAWATALLVAGPEHALRLAEKNNLAAVFIFQGEDGRYTEKVTASAKPYLAEN